MIGLLIKLGLALAPALLPKVLGWFGITLKETDLQVGERLGKAETIASQKNKDISDAQKAVDAGRTAVADDTTGKLRDVHPGDKPWDPNAIG